MSEKFDEEIALEDFKVCRELMLENIRIMEKNESYVVAAVAAIIVFGITQTNEIIFLIHAMLVCIVIGLGSLRFFGLRHTIHIADEYSKIGGSTERPRWAKFYEEKSRGTLGHSRYAFWVCLGLLAAFYLGLCLCHGPFTSVVPTHR